MLHGAGSVDKRFERAAFGFQSRWFEITAEAVRMRTFDGRKE
jgi:hypothetical protein